MIPLTLNNVVQIVVEIAMAAAPRPTFNEGLIMGVSTHIPTATRVRRYTDLPGMVTDGFLITDPEYLAAQLYFAQNPAPEYLSVGRQDNGAMGTLTLNAGGTGYSVNDICTVVQSGGVSGTVKVLTVNAGVVLTFSIVTNGTGYAVANGLSTTGGTGTGFKVNITAVQNEDPTLAMQACRAVSPHWYAGYLCGAAKADDIALALWAESAVPPSIYMIDTSDADARAGQAGNVFSVLKGDNYNRTIGLWSTVLYAGAAAMGRAMGLNTGLANSAFIIDFKTLVGVTPENLALSNPLSENDIQTIEGNNGNVYIERGGFYDFFEKGAMPSGRWLDQIINSDMLAVNIQLNVMDLLYGTPKIPQTEAGVNQIVHVINQACDQAVTVGYLAPGTWMGLINILKLYPGDPMPRGYVVQSQTVASQSNADRQARKAPPIYVACHEAGGVQGVLIQVNVD